MADAAQQEQAALFVFPGGRLEAPAEFEYLRNSIYRLVNRENVDGLICWGSSLGGTVSVDEVGRYLQRFSDIPLVTVALKLPGKPSIAFDAYRGMHSVVSHCIVVHRAERLAFIRGPLNHASAQDRFFAFRDALHEHGLRFDGLLVSDPVPWNEGEVALRNLIETRKLIPGRDFDTLVCASDLLMLDAARHLERSGYRIPDDIRVVGFNDSPESRFMSSAGTTVRVPFPAMGRRAFCMLRDLVEGKVTVEDHVEPASLVVRASCGCNPAFHDATQSDEDSCDREQLTVWMDAVFDIDVQRRQAWVDPLIDVLYRGATAGSLKQFEDLLARVLRRLAGQALEPAVVEQIVAVVERLSDLPPGYRQDAACSIRRTVFEFQSRMADANAYETVRRSQILSSFKNDLLQATDRQAIGRIMHAHLPQVGIKQAFLVMTEDDLYSRCIGGYTLLGPLPQDDMIFPASLLLPDRLARMCRQGVHVVQPLFIENQPLGYLVTTVSDRDGTMYEDLRSSISSALKGILLFEQTVRAKEVAEQAEQAKMAFFATMGDGLKDPLASIIERLQDLEAIVEGQGPTTEVAQQLRVVRSEVEGHLASTTMLFDSTLAQAGALELDMRLLDCTAVFDRMVETGLFSINRPGRLPLVRSDARRLEQVFTIMAEHRPAVAGQPVIDVDIRPEGLAMYIQGPSGEVRSSSNALQLAEAIIRLHHGSLQHVAGGWTLTLPWLSVGSLVPETPESFSTVIGCLSGRIDDRPGEFLEHFAAEHGYGVRMLAADRILAGSMGIEACALLYWDADQASPEQWLAMRMLMQHRSLFKVPVICHAQDLTGSDLMEAIEAKTAAKQTGVVVWWGASVNNIKQLLGSMVALLETDSHQQFLQLSQECKPGAVVLTEVDLQRIALIRKGEATAVVPLVVLPDRFPDGEELERFCTYPHVVACHAGVADCSEFALRIRDLTHGGEVLPVHTGALVKRALKYIEDHAPTQVRRWKLAEAANVSEDYLTRVFKKELGMSPWEYLNRYRIHVASDLLASTNLPLSEVALQTGFQDQAYFCRVFKKYRGCTPSGLRFD